MWPFTSHGFDSLPRSRTEPDTTRVRARAHRDLANLQTLTGNPAPILKTLHADDRWRILITPGESERIVALLTRDIDYPNFKPSIAQRPAPEARGHDHHRMAELHPSWQSDDHPASTASAQAPRPA